MSNYNNIGWRRLRILVTNKCNYKCPFCHNEGQSKNGNRESLSLSDFKKLIDVLKDEPLEEFHFSGGEPFLSSDIIKMISYVNEHTSWDIGCATNLSMITDDDITLLKGTRVKFNIQFPYIDDYLFGNSTGNGNLSHIITNIAKVKDAGIRIGLNCVLQHLNINELEQMMIFAIEHELPLKFLPQIGLKGSEDFKNVVYPLLERYCDNKVDKGVGATRWNVSNGNKSTIVLYIDSPCFKREFDVCQRFGELRIFPDLSLQPCIMKVPGEHLNLNKKPLEVKAQLEHLWKSFNNC